jgi:arginyl-tRNA synthetase
MEALDECMASLSLSSPLPQVATARADVNPLDLCRVYLAKILVDILECDIEGASKAILWPNNISNGDLAVVLPKLRPSVKASEVGTELMQKVRYAMRLEYGT